MARHVERDDSPRRELERDPEVGGAPGATDQRVEEARPSLAPEPPPTVDAGSPPAPRLPADVPPSARAGEVHARPPSLQADEGQRDALPHERAPYWRVPEGDTLGVRHIREALADLLFPMTRAELLARAGLWRIPVTGRTFRTLAEYMEGVDDEEFRSADDVARAVVRARAARAVMGAPPVAARALTRRRGRLS